MNGPSDPADPAAPPRWTADQAHTLANVLSLTPFLFQAVAVMRDSGLLRATLAARRKGLTVEDAAEATGLSPYGLSILVDMGRSVGIFAPSTDGRLRPTSVAHFLVHHRGIDVQFGLSQHFAWSGLPALGESLATQTAAGLASFGDWDQLYPHLKDLPDAAREAWFAWDHHYSDSAFEEAGEVVLATEPTCVLDIGGNTGRFARHLLGRAPSVTVVLQDLPEQLAAADEQMGPEHAGRFVLHACDVLAADQPFYEGADAAWMSQFVCCFGVDEVTSILRRTAAALPLGAPIFVLDTFWDRQSEPSSAFALHAASLYFAAFANGKGRMYAATDLLRCADTAGLEVVGDQSIGRYHTLLTLRTP